MVEIFDRMTTDTGYTRLITGESGVGLVLAGLVIVLIFYGKRAKLEPALGDASKDRGLSIEAAQVISD